MTLIPNEINTYKTMDIFIKYQAWKSYERQANKI